MISIVYFQFPWLLPTDIANNTICSKEYRFGALRHFPTEMYNNLG